MVKYKSKKYRLTTNGVKYRIEKRNKFSTWLRHPFKSNLWGSIGMPYDNLDDGVEKFEKFKELEDYEKLKWVAITGKE
jgi:hypothetical protein